MRLAVIRSSATSGKPGHIFMFNFTPKFTKRSIFVYVLIGFYQ